MSDRCQRCDKHPGRFHNIYDCKEQRLINCVICELEKAREDRMLLRQMLEDLAAALNRVMIGTR